jgi:hypothetical protein
MPGFFEAIGKIQPRVKKYWVTIQGRSIEVSLEKKLEILRAGEDRYMLDGETVKLKPVTKTKRRFPVLKDLDRDPYWIDTEERYTWQIESE